MKSLKFFILILFSVLLSCEQEEDLDKTSNNVVEITDINSLVSKVEEVYSTATTYRDTGIVSTNFITDEVRLVEKPFKTAFMRIGLYRYEYHEIGRENSGYIIHRDHNGLVSTWWGVTGEQETEKSLSLAIAGATGVSSTSSFHIPSFLMPDELNFTNVLRRLENKEILGSESIEGIDCYKITGSHDYDGDIYTIWIQKKNFLIRRISDGHQFETFRTESTIDILAEINIGMFESEFDFNPPTSKVVTTKSEPCVQSDLSNLINLEMGYEQEKQLDKKMLDYE